MRNAKRTTPHLSSPYLRGGWVGLMLLFFLITRYPLPVTAVDASEKWSGVDESVIEKYAKEHGREAREPLINTDQGDLLLFVFLLAGTVGGFAAGYYWRTLMGNRSQKQEPGSRTEEQR